MSRLIQTAHQLYLFWHSRIILFSSEGISSRLDTGRHKKWPLAGKSPEQAHGVARVDRSPVLAGKTGRVDVRDRRLDRVGGSKRHVGAEEYVSRAEELEDAAYRMWRAEERRVNVESAEVVQQGPRQGVLDLAI